MDKLKHLGICFAVTLFRGLEIGIWVGVIIELTQAEYGGHYPWKRSFWQRLLTRDTLFDLIADGLGIYAGVYIRRLLFNN